MLKKFLQSKSEFSKNVLILMTGTSIAQAIPLAIMPILTRIYTPDAYGLFSLYMSIASILAIIATGRYELSLVLPDKNKDAINLAALSLFITFFISLLSLFVVVVFNSEIASLLNSPEAATWLYLLPLTVLVTGFYQCMNYWMNRHKRYRDIAVSKVLQAGAAGGSNIGMGLGGCGGFGLIWGAIIGQAVSGIKLVLLFLKSDISLLKEVTLLKIICLLKKFKKLPIYNLPSTLIEALKLSVISIIIAKLYSTSILGQFYLAWAMLQVPMALLGNSLSQVFFQKIASVEKAEINAIIKLFIIRASLFISPVFVAIYLFSEDVFVIVFGGQWALAGDVVSILTPWLFLTFLTQPLSAFFVVVNRQEIPFLFSIISALVLFGSIYLYRDLDFIGLLNVITEVMIITLLVYLFIVVWFSHKFKN